jgi:hypothetical protein
MGENMTRIKINLSFPQIKQISNKEYHDMLDHAIKVWHFEKRGDGVVPVKGECDPNNPDHIPVRKVVRCHP